MTDEFQQYCISVAEEFLKRVRGLTLRQASAHDAINQQIAILDGLKAIDYSVSQISGGSSHDSRLVEVIEKIDGMVSQYRAMVDDWQTAIGHAKDILARMDDQLYASVLERYYLSGHTWRSIAASMGYSVDNIYKIRPYALVAFYAAMTNYETGMVPAI